MLWWCRLMRIYVSICVYVYIYTYTYIVCFLCTSNRIWHVWNGSYSLPSRTAGSSNIIHTYIFVIKIDRNLEFCIIGLFSTKKIMILSILLRSPPKIEINLNYCSWVSKSYSLHTFLNKMLFSMLFYWIWKPIQDVGHIWHTRRMSNMTYIGISFLKNSRCHLLMIIICTCSKMIMRLSL